MFSFFKEKKPEQQSFMEEMSESEILKKRAECLDKGAAAAAVTGILLVGGGACASGLTGCAYPLITNGISVFGCFIT